MPASTRARSTVKNEKLAQRLSDILARLHQGEALDKHQLVAQYQVQVRTIERDLGERLCGIAVRCEDGLWRLTQAARGTIPAHYLSEYQRLAGTERLFPDPSLRYLLEQLETPPPQRSTQVQPLPHEDLGARSPLFTQLQNAIEARHVCHFTYKAKPRQVQPYRLIHRGGVWYLAAEEAGRLKNFSVALLEGLDEGVLQSVYDNILKLSPGAEYLIAECKRHEVKFLLVSGGFTFFTDRLQQQLGIDYAYANVLEIVDGKLTGKLKGRMIDAQAKADLLCEHQEALGLTPEQVLAVGDGANDIPMLQAAGIGVAYHAKPKTEQHADVAVRFNGLEALRGLFA